MEQAQSPIDIDTYAVAQRRLSQPAFDYPAQVPLSLANTGSPAPTATVKASVPVGTAALEVDGRRYALAQFHWHTPAEHQVDGVVAPLEMHLVHESAQYQVLVLGVRIAQGSHHAELEKIFGNLPQPTSGTMHVDAFDLRTLLPATLASYRYDGSLTTPPFAEGVSWVLFAEALEMSDTQIAAFRGLFDSGNARDVQPLNGRVVYSDVEVDES